MFETNKVDDECNEIREAIVNDKKKLRNIIFNKCIIINDILYYKNRLSNYEYISRFNIYTLLFNIYIFLFKLNKY